MFYTEEELLNAVDHAVSIFGKNGEYVSGNKAISNVSIATRQYGKIWYGDVQENTIESKCNELSIRLNQPVYLFYQNNDFMFDDSLMFFAGKPNETYKEN